MAGEKEWGVVRVVGVVAVEAPKPSNHSYFATWHTPGLSMLSLTLCQKFFLFFFLLILPCFSSNPLMRRERESVGFHSHNLWLSIASLVLYGVLCSFFLFFFFLFFLNLQSSLSFCFFCAFHFVFQLIFWLLTSLISY